MTPLELALEVPALKRLTGVDCSTSRCYANAYGTGRLMRETLAGKTHYFVEFRCPDCGASDMQVSSRDVDALAAALLAATPSERDAIAERWVAPRIGDVHPCRPRG